MPIFKHGERLSDLLRAVFRQHDSALSFAHHVGNLSEIPRDQRTARRQGFVQLVRRAESRVGILRIESVVDDIAGTRLIRDLFPGNETHIENAGIGRRRLYHQSSRTPLPPMITYALGYWFDRLPTVLRSFDP